jgi:hypothetical protein
MHCDIGCKIALAILTGEIKQRSGAAAKPGADQPSEILFIAVRPRNLAETRRARGFRGAAADDECWQLYQFSNAPMTLDRPRSVGAGHDHCAPGFRGQIGGEYFHAQQRCD